MNPQKRDFQVTVVKGRLFAHGAGFRARLSAPSFLIPFALVRPLARRSSPSPIFFSIPAMRLDRMIKKDVQQSDALWIPSNQHPTNLFIPTAEFPGDARRCSLHRNAVCRFSFLLPTVWILLQPPYSYNATAAAATTFQEKFNFPSTVRRRQALL